MQVLRRWPPGFLLWNLRFFLPAALVIRWLSGTLAGAFVTSVTLYAAMNLFADTKPFTPSELLVWFSGLSPELKGGIVSSLVTAVGFFVAFRAASLSWKEQAAITLRITAIDEVSAFYDETLKVAGSMEAYAGTLVNALSQHGREQLSQEGFWLTEHLIKTGEKFVQDRDRLGALSIDVHRLSAKHGSLLVPVPDAIQVLNDCAKALGELSAVVWIHLPQPSVASIRAASFIAPLQVEQWAHLIAVSEKFRNYIAALLGALRGQIYLPVAPPNFGLVSVLRSDPAALKDMLRVMRSAK